MMGAFDEAADAGVVERASTELPPIAGAVNALVKSVLNPFFIVPPDCPIDHGIMFYRMNRPRSTRLQGSSARVEGLPRLLRQPLYPSEPKT